MAQQQQVNPQLPDPTATQLRDYKLGMERATAHFCQVVNAQGRQAYVDLINDLKVTSCKLISDLVDADEDEVLQLIRRTDGQHFKTGVP